MRHRIGPVTGLLACLLVAALLVIPARAEDAAPEEIMLDVSPVEVAAEPVTPPTAEPVTTPTAESPAAPTPQPVATPTPTFALYKGIPTGLTAEGFPFLGYPDAKVTLVDYSDFVCPNCRSHARTVEPVIIDRYVRQGHVRLVFRDVLNHGMHSVRAAEAGACAARQDHFWQMHELLFERMNEVASATEDGLFELMKHIGGHVRTMDQGMFIRCLADRATVRAIQAADAEQRRRGITSQPVFEIGTRRLFGNQSYEVFQSALDAALRNATR